MQAVLAFDDEVLDRARVSRDARFDGKFFIAVTSTGIYCRPICPVRSPKKANVRYYATAAAAAEAGYRPCLRCRPEAAPGTAAWLGTSAVVRRALRLIHEGALNECPVSEFATRLGVGVRHLHRLFMQHVGASPIAVAQTARLHFAKRLLDETDLAVTEIALAAGFGSIRRFNSAFLDTYGRSPRELRRRRMGISGTGGADEIVLKLAFRPPYDWACMRDALAARAIPGVEQVTVDAYARIVAVNDAVVTMSVRTQAGENSLELRVRGACAADLLQISSRARQMFDLAADPAMIAGVLSKDPLLASWLRARPGLRIHGSWDPFECLVQGLLGQQDPPQIARARVGRLVELAGTPVDSGVEGLTHCFPSPDQLAEAQLEGLGVNRSVAETLRRLSRAVADGALDFSAPAEEVIGALAAWPGVPALVAQQVALSALGEPDAFPLGSVNLAALAPLGKGLSLGELEARAERWRPWRGYALLHLQSAVLQGEGTSDEDYGKGRQA
jgi:AraC family transcriptional regulator of adaptative response / DNA-3-methyladenine glycosylase II